MFLKTLIFVLFIIHTTYSIAEIDNVSKDESKNNNCQNFCDGFYGIESVSSGFTNPYSFIFHAIFVFFSHPVHHVSMDVL